SAGAQGYPSRPITMLVGYAVGGPSDTIARIMADRMKTALGQPLIVENVTGAAGSLAVGRGARAAPDGYTLVMGDWSTHVVTGSKIQLVPYRGAALVMQDMVASTIQLSMFPVTVALPQVRAGHVRAYAITALKRSAAAPDIPTVDEAGLPGFHISLWWGFWMPKGTPKDIVTKLNAAVVEALADPATQK